MNSERNILWAFWLNLTFAIVEMLGAFLTNSVSIASDAVHDLTDSLALGLGWYLERFSKRQADQRYHFGYKRFSLLAALINSQVLILGSILVLREAVPRLWNPETVHPGGMIGFAIAGILINGFGAWRLHRGHSHNESVLSLHFLEDVLGWIAVLIVAIAIKLGDYAILDPILSVAIALFMLWNATKRMLDTGRIFLQSAPEKLDLETIRNLVHQLPNVQSILELRLWSLDGREHVLSLRVRLKEGVRLTDALDLKTKIRHCLSSYEFYQLNVEFE